MLRIRTGRRKGPLAEELVEYLACHGSRATIVRREPTGARIGDQLLAECRTLGADLLVLGVRSQTRLSEWILGSVTQQILDGADIRVLASN